MLFLVRHAKAGSRTDWDADDFARPLTGKGRRQAAAIAERLLPQADLPVRPVEPAGLAIEDEL